MESNNHIITFVLNKVVSAKYRLPFLFMGMWNTESYNTKKLELLYNTYYEIIESPFGVHYLESLARWRGRNHIPTDKSWYVFYVCR